MTRRKKCDDFWLPGAESFPMVYIMNDFAAIIFRRYYTLRRMALILQIEHQGNRVFKTNVSNGKITGEIFALLSFDVFGMVKSCDCAC